MPIDNTVSFVNAVAAANVDTPSAGVRLFLNSATGLLAVKLSDGSVVDWDGAGVVSAPIALTADGSVDTTYHQRLVRADATATLTLPASIDPGLDTVLVGSSTTNVVTVEAGSGATLIAADTLSTLSEVSFVGGSLRILCISTDTWLIDGDYSAGVFPLSLPGLLAGYDASDKDNASAIQIRDAGAGVYFAEELYDLSGNGHDMFAQATASLQPRIAQSVVNGLDALHIDGTTIGMQQATTDLFDAIAANGTLYLSARALSNQSTARHLLHASRTDSSTPRIGLGTDRLNASQRVVQSWDNGSAVFVSPGSNFLTSWHTQAMRRDGVNVRGYANGTQVFSVTYDTPDADRGFAIGKHQDCPVSIEAFYAMEFWFYSTAHTSDERTNMQNYLSARIT